MSNDKVRGSGDNNFYVDLIGAGLPATVDQPISLALALRQVSNVSLIDNNAGGDVSAAIGNLFRAQLTVTVAATVPEPSIWGAMILGFGLVGISIRRRVATITAA